MGKNHRVAVLTTDANCAAISIVTVVYKAFSWTGASVWRAVPHESHSGIWFIELLFLFGRLGTCQENITGVHFRITAESSAFAVIQDHSAGISLGV